MAVKDYLPEFEGVLGGGIGSVGGGLTLFDLLKTRTALAVASAGAVVAVVLLRIVLSPVAGAVHPITYLGVVGGFVGGAVMSWLIGAGIDATGAGLVRLRGLQWAHVVYAALAGGFYPWVFKALMHSPRELFITYPGVLNGTYMWSMIMFVVAAAVYLLVGTIGGVSNYLVQWGGIIGLYIVYGVVLGFWLGLAHPAWYPLLRAVGLL